MKRCSESLNRRQWRMCFPLIFWLHCEDCDCSFKWEWGIKRKKWGKYVDSWLRIYKCNECAGIFYEPMGR